MAGCRWLVVAWILQGKNARKITSDRNQILETVCLLALGLAAEQTRVKNAEHDSDRCLSQFVSSIISWHLSKGCSILSK